MNGINNKHNIEIEVLTPLSIGAGNEKDWARGIDFIVDNHNLYKLNLRKMVDAGFKPEDLAGYFASRNELGLRAKLANRLQQVSDEIIPYPEESDNDVKSFIKNPLSGNPIVPGSSLKGAIRSVLYEYFGAKSKDGKEVFGTAKDGDEFMRFIKISDAEFEATSLVNTKIFNLQNKNGWRGGWKHGTSETTGTFCPTGFNTLYESLMPKQRAFASLLLSETAFKNFEGQRKHVLRDKKLPILSDNLETLFSIINQHTKCYLEKEKAFFEKYPTDRSDVIVDNIENLLKLIPSDNTYCILKMSAGSGFHSITGDWQFDDYSTGTFDRKRNKEGKVLPKSRKIAIHGENLSLMGFVKIRPVSEADIETAKREKEQMMLRLQEEEKRIQEEIIKQQLFKEETERKFNAAMLEVKSLYDQRQYESALEKFNEVVAAFPNCHQDIIDLDELRFKVDAVIAERKQQEIIRKNADAAAAAQKEKVEGGMEKLLNEKYDFGPNLGKYKVADFKSCSNKITSWLKAAKVEKVPVEQQQVLLSTLKRLYETANAKDKKNWNEFNGGVWRQIITWVGEETARQWFDELNA